MFTLGTLSCSVCGSIFPLTTSSTRGAVCTTCGVHSGDVSLYENGAMPKPGGAFFSPEDIRVAQKAVQERIRTSLASSGKAGVTEVDNRVVEETFCEHCGKHTMCRSFARQTRSADEGQTIFFQCTICKSEWQQNS